MGSRQFWMAALAGGMLAGTLDIVYAFCWAGYYGRAPQWVLQSVATGWLGKAAFTGGMSAALLGLASHYGISILWAAAYGVVRGFSAWARQHWLLAGTILGVLVALVMNYVVIPLSAAPFKPSYA